MSKTNERVQGLWFWILMLILIAFVFKFHPDEYFMALWEGIKAVSR